MRTSASRLISSLLVVVGVAPAPSVAQDHRTDFGQRIDYIVPDEGDLAASRVRRLSAPAVPLADGEVVAYTAFNGQQHALRRFEGSHVTMLLPDAWLPPSGLSEIQRRVAIDRADHLYVLNQLLLGREPRGAGKLVMAVVPTCGAGCGMLGAKGIEIAPDQYNIDAFKETGDTPAGVVIHEMNHNFDVFYRYHAYVPDPAHAWTFMMDAAVPSYMLTGTYAPPERLRQYAAGLALLPRYMTDPNATWQACLAGNQSSCPYAFNALWGATGLHTLLLDGLAVLPRFLEHLRTWADANPAPATPQAKEDLHIAALSAATNTDLGCYVDGWKWWASPALRSTMAQRGPNRQCLDSDGDGSRPFDGDPDDADGARHPGAIEVVNGIDDDGDGAVDDLPFVEPPGADFPATLAVGTGARIDAALTAGDGDQFVLTVPVPARYRFSLESRATFKGWLFLYNANGTWRQYIHAGEGRESSMYADLTPGTWRFAVNLNVNSAPGPYRARAYAAQPWPTLWGRASVGPAVAASAYRLTAITDNTSGFAAPPTEVRFWVSGHGFVGSQPWAPSVSMDWTPPVTDPRPLLVRAQPFRAGAPVADLTSPADLPLVGAPTNFAASVTGNTLTLSWAAGVGLLAPTGYVLAGGGTAGSSAVTLAVGAGTAVTLQAPTGAYFVRLFAVSGTLLSSASNEIRVYFNVPGPPSAPSNLLGTVSGESLTLAWRLGSSATPLTGLLLDVTGSLSTVLSLPVGETMSFAGVPAGTYTVGLRAVNAIGASSSSAPVTLTVPSACAGPPLAPVNFTAIRSGRAITVTWDLPPSGAAPSSYALHVRGALTLDLPLSTRTVSGLVPPGTYMLSVSAQSLCGAGPATSVETVVVP